MKTSVPVLLLSVGLWLVSSHPVRAEDPAGRALLEHLMDKPGSCAQMCSPWEPTPFNVPVPVFSGNAIERYFDLGKKEAADLQAKRAQVIPALVEALTAMDLTKPPQITRGFNDPGEGNGTHAGFRLNWLNPLHLKIVRQLNAVETLPELLRLEAQLQTLLEVAEKDLKAPLPPLDEDASLFPDKTGRGEIRTIPELKKDPQFVQDCQILTCRIFQRELLGTITVLLRNEDFAPAKEKFELQQRETNARLIKEAGTALAAAEKKLAAAREDKVKIEEENRRWCAWDHAQHKLEHLENQSPDAGFAAAFTPALRNEIRSFAESFLKTIPPEKRRAAAAMPKHVEQK